MSTVGISFGSATSGAGFDVTSTVTSILAVAQAIETPWQTQLSALQAQDTALSGLGTNLSTLSTDVSALTDPDGVMASKQGSSSDTNVLALSSASSSAIAGSHTVTVTSLAQTSSEYSGQIANASDTLSGSLTIQIGTAAAQTITLGSTSNTLQTLATAINSGTYGVTASVVSSATGSRLSLVSNSSGSAGQMTLTPSLTDATTSANVAFTVGQTGVDAQLNVDGLDTTSASNTVTGAIPGVTFQLLASAVGTPVQIQITNNNSSIETTVQSMVTDYNTVISAMKTQEGNTSTGAAEPLYGSPTLALMQEQLSSAMLGGTASGTINNIGQLGISLNDDGTLTLDTSTLDSVLNSNFSDVQGYFQNVGSFGQTLSTALNSLGTASPTGAISLALSQDSTEESGLNTDVTNENTIIATEKTNLTTELNTANQVLQSIPQQLTEVNEIYDASTGYNEASTS
jgi:flagellar hook-associated protein 2